MTLAAKFHAMFQQSPLIAILRGVLPDEVEAIGEELIASGITLIEVPLNSFQPFDSIALLAKRCGDRALVGAGTVVTLKAMHQVREVGGEMIVAPCTNAAVIREAAEHGMVPIPGFFTPSEAYEAIDAGAQALKFFPAEAARPRVLASIRAALPRDVPILPVGGIEPGGLREWLDAGANGFGVGSTLYRPGMSPSEVGERARAFRQALAEAQETHDGQA